MFKMFSPTFLVVPVAWLTVLALTALNALAPILQRLGVAPRLTWIIFFVQALVALFFITPLWRVIWRIIPPLNRFVYPDLNGEWDVDLESNWPRIEAMLDAAAGKVPPIDIRYGEEGHLPPLGRFRMRARITQSWARMKMELWNPENCSPIRESQTLVVHPFRGEDGRHGLTYVYEQENATDEVSDDPKFKGAAWLVRDRDDLDVLHGRMWSDRVWRRGMNTAADLRFTRRRTEEGGEEQVAGGKRTLGNPSVAARGSRS